MANHVTLLITMLTASPLEHAETPSFRPEGPMRVVSKNRMLDLHINAQPLKSRGDYQFVRTQNSTVSNPTSLKPAST